MSKENGGPAFPDPGRAQSQKQRELLGNEGMTLRDYFAIRASEEDIKAHRGAAIAGERFKSREEARYAYADAMLAERSKP